MTHSNLISALNISLIGSAIVFSSIFILWGLISILTYKRQPHNKVREEIDNTGKKMCISEGSEDINIAAVVGVSIALCLKEQVQQADKQIFHSDEDFASRVSPWQSVMRANMLNKRGRVR